MIKFNALRLSEDRKYIEIDVRIDDAGIYSGLNISGVYVDYYRNFGEEGPSSVSYSFPLDGESRRFTGRFSLDLLSEEQKEKWPDTLEKGLFYVFVECDGEYDDTRFSEDELMMVGAVPDWERVYEVGMQLVKGVIGNCGNICDPKCGWADFIFRWHALKLGILTSDYYMVNDLWPLMFGNDEMAASGGCGCNR